MPVKSSARPYSCEDFLAAVPVSRETAVGLRRYAEVLVKWQRAVNLVGPGTVADLWRRHFLDSAQLLPYLPAQAPRPARILDIGSGAGFPGLVLAICRPDLEVHLVDSDTRKCAFLREVARETAAAPVIHATPLERVAPFAADRITARACAPLDRLLAMAEPFLAPETECLFLKGRRAEEELTAAAKVWNMRAERAPSLSDPSGTVLRLTEVTLVRN